MCLLSGDSASASVPLCIVFTDTWYLVTCPGPGGMGGGAWGGRAVTMMLVTAAIAATAVIATVAVYMRGTLAQLHASKGATRCVHAAAIVS